MRSILLFADDFGQSQASHYLDLMGNQSNFAIVSPSGHDQSYIQIQQQMLLKHNFNKKCSVTKKFQCMVCFKWFSRKWNMTDHMLHIHNYIMK